jgi:hypothetical protein
MPRAYNLTWMPTSKRWRKKYKGAIYYFPANDGETKEASYRRCWGEWGELTKTLENQIAVETPNQVAWRNFMALFQGHMDQCRSQIKQLGFTVDLVFTHKPSSRLQ